MIASADGCRAGWLVAIADGWPGSKTPALAVCPTFRDLLAYTTGCAMVVVDMPIGLPSGREKRACDLEARRLLAPTGSSRVFMTPPRETLTAETYNAFNQQHRQITGQGVSRQVWGIVPKLIEVDREMTPELQEKIREFHPELAWTSLAGRVLHSKHEEDGINERWAVLERVSARSIKNLRERKAPIGTKVDDVLDALVGLTRGCVDYRINSLKVAFGKASTTPEVFEWRYGIDQRNLR